MKVWFFPGILGILAIFAGNLAFLISASEGYLELCFPYLEGCSSISKSGREGLAQILFKMIVLPVMTLLIVYWSISWNFLKTLVPQSKVQNMLILFLGILGSFFGILYTSFLGHEGDFYQLLRRFGIYFFFLGTYFAQVIEVKQLLKIAEFKNFVFLKSMKFLTFLIGFVVLVSVPFYAFIEDDDWLENILEWNITFLVFFYFILCSPLWKRIELKMNVKLENSSEE